jgi:hypothetical protein
MEHSKKEFSLIAPCGMNCQICKAYLRVKNPCHGCNYAERNRPKTRAGCRIRICRMRRGKFCFACADFPCASIISLDQRYRTKYGMSEIENLEYIRDKGLKKFLDKERRKWITNKGIFCVHDKKYY